MIVALLPNDEWTVVEDEASVPSDAIRTASNPSELSIVFNDRKESLDSVRMAMVPGALYAEDLDSAKLALWAAFVAQFFLSRRKKTRGPTVTVGGSIKFADCAHVGMLWEFRYDPADPFHVRRLAKRGAAINAFVAALLSTGKRLFTMAEMLEAMKSSAYRKTSDKVSWEVWVVNYVCVLKSMGFMTKGRIEKYFSKYPGKHFLRARGIG